MHFSAPMWHETVSSVRPCLVSTRWALTPRLFDRLRYDVYPLVEEYLFGDPSRMVDVPEDVKQFETRLITRSV